MMFDLCTQPEQPELAPAHTEMENRVEAEPVGQQQQETRRSTTDQDKIQPGVLEKDVPSMANFTTTSLLGKRHHSLYANLSGLEIEGAPKVNKQPLSTITVVFLDL